MQYVQHEEFKCQNTVMHNSADNSFKWSMNFASVSIRLGEVTNMNLTASGD